MSPSPEPHDPPHTPFDPRDEVFLNCLRQLIPFEIELIETKDWGSRIETLYSSDITEAAEYAFQYFQRDGWLVTKVRRMIEKEPGLNIPALGDPDDFIEIMRQTFGEESDHFE
jgi:hypothetical protein